MGADFKDSESEQDYASNFENLTSNTKMRWEQTKSKQNQRKGSKLDKKQRIDEIE